MKNLTIKELNEELHRAITALEALSTKDNQDRVLSYIEELREELKSRGEQALAA